MNIIEVLNSKEDIIYGKGAKAEEIEEAERQLGVSFASDYKEYLEHFGMAMFDGHELSGIGVVDRLNVVSMTKEKNEENPFTKGMYIIENLYFDSVIIWQDSNGIIYETEYNNKPKELYKSFADYIK